MAMIGRYVLDNENYGVLTEAAFTTPIGKVSEIVETTLGEATGFFILYPIAKTSSHLESHYDEIAAVYVENEIGKILYDTQSKLSDSVKTTSLLDSLNYSKITYPTVNRK